MTARQIAILIATLVVAVLLTVVAGVVLPPLAVEPIGSGPWWSTLLRMLVPLAWVFFFILLVFWGVLALIAIFQRRRGAA